MNKKIGILGCGWLGLPLATSLIRDQHTVRGTTTSDSKIELLQKANIIPFTIALRENGIEGNIEDFLAELDLLVINVPPQLRSDPKESYIKKMLLLYDKIKNTSLRCVIFISSTSVYGDITGVVTEDSPTRPNTESGRQLLAAENIWLNDRELNTTIIRFGGLIGPSRHPVTFLAGKSDLTNGNDPVNLIHLNDCIGIIKLIMNGNWKNKVINGVYPLHPTKESYYTSEAIKRGLLSPIYTNKLDRSENKSIKSKYLNVKIYPFKTSIIS
ncbi:MULTISPECIES: SDR family oxidoreductase [unclassified Arenibacter]|uniref:SDR family oxidoreductase n=1 Tax=unclassified Arenibacter TaxID=2615047 RepID=UPI000E3419C4|nr:MULTISPECIES: SDR family oxidoreductase [unclassified Arenibacter]MCM4162250.1 NAD(P)-dependent oxidoreductase [Arenibacter sp. A80]RFT57856.1 SDR family oxidoreductase [Arenibacter sp. P308M17]